MSPVQARTTPSLQTIQDQCDSMARMARDAIKAGGVLVMPGEVVAGVTINDTRRTMILDAEPRHVAEYLTGLVKLWKKRGVTQAERDALAKVMVAAGKGDGA